MSNRFEWTGMVPIQGTLFRIDRNQPDFEGHIPDPPAHVTVDPGGWVIAQTGAVDGPVHGTLTYLDTPPHTVDPDGWQHIAEATSTGTHRLAVRGMDAETPTIAVPVDSHHVRVRVHWKGHVTPFTPANHYPLPGDPPGEELLIQIWDEPAPRPAEIILNSYEPPD